MAQKKITDLTLRSNADATCNFPVDDDTQTWRITAAQLKAYILAAGSVSNTELNKTALTAQTEDTAPDPAADYFLSYDASATALKKVLMNKLKKLVVQTKTTTYTADATDDVILCSGSAFTVTLPAAASNPGKLYWVKKTDATMSNIITVNGTTLNTQDEEIRIISDGTNWINFGRTYPSIWSGSYSPTGAWVSNTTYTAKWKRVGSEALFRVRVALAGAPTTADLTVVFLPSGMPAVDTSAMVSTSGLPYLGQCEMQASGNHYPGWVIYSSSTVVKVLAIAGANTNTHNGVFVSQASPTTFTNGDYLDMEFKLPITGWN